MTRLVDFAPGWKRKALMNPVGSLFYYPRRLYEYVCNRLTWEVIEYGDMNTRSKARNRSSGKTMYVDHRALFSLHFEYAGWNRHYLPRFSLSNKTVLDIGASCGDTAYFFYAHGASRVIAVESDEKAFRLLDDNRLLNHWDMTCKLKPFDLSDLSYQFDLCKMDVEGCEVELLKLDKLNFPLIVESHSDEIRDALLGHFPELYVKTSHPVYQTDILSNCG